MAFILLFLRTVIRNFKFSFQLPIFAHSTHHQALVGLEFSPHLDLVSRLPGAYTPNSTRSNCCRCRFHRKALSSECQSRIVVTSNLGRSK